jgi:protein-S-isoprenylcysteine O-methyltransferase
MRPWLVGAVWIAWLVAAAGAGYARSRVGDRIDDRATRASVRADVVTAMALAAGVAAALAVPGAAIPGDPWLTVVAGTALVALGIALRLWAARALGSFFTRSIVIREGHRVVTSGPYRIVRHPGYAGILMSLVGLALTLGNWLGVLLVIVGFFAGNVPRIAAEERALEEHLGEQYRDFERARKRLIPGIW